MPGMGRAQPTAAPRSSLMPLMEPRSAQLPAGMGGRGAPGAGPTGGMAGRISGMFGGGGGPAPRAAQGLFGGAGALMSDERSKEKIRELEGIKQRYMALLDGPSGGGDAGHSDRDGIVTSSEVDYSPVGSHEFEYKPEYRDEPGAGRGRFAGPMTSELKGIPGVVKSGPGGMEQVDAPRLTMANASQIGNLTREKADRSELDDLRARLAALSDDPDGALDVAGGRRR